MYKFAWVLWYQAVNYRSLTHLGLLLLQIFFDRHNLIMSHGWHQNHAVGLSTSERVLNFAREIIRPIRKSHILANVGIFIHKGDKPISGDVNKCVLFAHNIGNERGVGGGNNILVFFPGEDIDCGKVALCMTMLSSFGSRDSGDLMMDGDVLINILQKR